MTMNTAALDYMNKCLIDLSPSFSCITISKILVALFFSALITCITIFIMIKFQRKQKQESSHTIK